MSVCVHHCVCAHPPRRVSVCTPPCLCTPPTACQCVYTAVSVHTPHRVSVCVHHRVCAHPPTRVSVCTPPCLCTPPTACQCVYTTVSVHSPPKACLLVRPAPAPAAGPRAHLCWCSGRHFSLTLPSGPGSCVSGHRPRQAEPLSEGRTRHETCHHGRRAVSGTERALDGLCLTPSPHCPFLGSPRTTGWLGH